MKKIVIYIPLILSSLISLSAAAQNKCLTQIDAHIIAGELVELQSCQLQDGDIPLLVNLLRNNYPNVHELNLENNQINESGATALGDFLKDRQEVELNINKNNISDTGMIALSKDSTIVSLLVDSNNIGPEGAKAIASMNVTYLHISHNHLGDEGMKALSKNKKFEAIVAEDNNIGMSGAIAIASLPALQSISLNDNPIGNEGADAFGSYFSGESLSLCNNNIHDNGMLRFINQPLAKLYSLYVENNHLSPYRIKLLENTYREVYSDGNDGSDPNSQKHRLSFIENANKLFCSKEQNSMRSICKGDFKK